MQAAADEAAKYCREEQVKREKELVNFFKEQGLKVYTPDLDAFRKHAQEMYLNSDFAKNWPEGLLEKINGL